MLQPGHVVGSGETGYWCQPRRDEYLVVTVPFEKASREKLCRNGRGWRLELKYYKYRKLPRLLARRERS
jgi:hypothetical protein